MKKQIIVGDSQDAKSEEEKKTRNTDIPGCIRRLWNGERTFLWGPNYNEAVAARIIGDVSEQDLKRALDTVRRIHPLLGAKVIFDAQHDAWFSTDNVPGTILRTVQRTSDTQWFDEIQKEHMIPFELETGPLIRFVLIYSPQVSELIVFAQHSICDGVALANLIRDILLFYAEPAKEIKVIEPSLSTDYLQLNESLSSSKSNGNDAINNLNLQWRQRPYYFSQADFIEVHKAYCNKMQYNIALLQLEPEETSILGVKCRENGITINSAMTAAFLAAYQDVIGSFPGDRNMIGIPYDLRRRLPENVRNAAFCFFIGGTGFPYLYEQKKNLWENAQEIHKMIHKGMEQLDIWGRELLPFDPALLDAKIFASFMQLVPKVSEETKNLRAFAQDAENIAFMISNSSKVGVAILNTNLGRLDYPENYGNLKLDRMFFTPSGADVPILLGGIGFNGKIAFTLNYVNDMEGDDNSSPDRDMIRIRNRVLELLGFPEKANNRAI